MKLSILNNRFLYKKNMLIFLSKIYGIGFSKSIYILSLFGINLYVKMSLLDKDLVLILDWIIIRFYLLEDKLKKQKEFSLYKILRVGSLRSIRLKNFLPVNGQRTQTNAKTRKKLSNRKKIKVVIKSRKVTKFFSKNVKNKKNFINNKKNFKKGKKLNSFKFSFYKRRRK